MSLGLFGRPEGASVKPFWPRALFSTPPGNRKSASPSCYFLPPRRDPPGNPIWRLYTYFQRFLMILQRTQVRKGAPRDPPIIERPPAGAPPRPPKMVRARPGGPEGSPGSRKRPKVVRAHPIQVRTRKIKYCFTRGFGELFFGKVAVVPMGSILLRSKKVTPRAPGGGRRGASIFATRPL